MFSCLTAQCCYQSGNSRTLIVLVSWPCSSGRNHSDFLPQAQPRMSRAFLSLLCSCHPISSEMPTSTPSTSKAHSPFTSLLLLLRKTTLKPQSVSKPLHQQCFKQPLCAGVPVQQHTWGGWILLLSWFVGVLGASPFLLVLNFTEHSCVTKN